MIRKIALISRTSSGIGIACIPAANGSRLIFERLVYRIPVRQAMINALKSRAEKFSLTLNPY